MASFKHEGHRLSYTVYGEGPRTTVLLPGLLLSQRMHLPLAVALAERGNRAVTLDFLGHGKSDRPRDMRVYSMESFAGEVVGLLDHLEVDDAVVLGTSLGANVALNVAEQAPERLRGMVIEMPVLDNALLGCAIAFTPLMVALSFGAPVMRGIGAMARAVPRGRVPLLAQVGLDWVSQDPAPSAAVLNGLFFNRVAPPSSVRRTLETPGLVIGHPRDPVHPFSDANALASELPNGRLLDADSLIEMRLSPERLTGEISEFIEGCWKPKRAAGARKRTTVAKRPAAKRRGRAAGA